MSTPPDAPAIPDAAALIEYVGGRVGRDEAYAHAKISEAIALVNRHRTIADSNGRPILDEDGQPTLYPVPVEVLYPAFLEVGSALWSRKNANGGGEGYDPAAVVGTGDPLHTARVTLAPFLPAGIA
jgi:hypothetical protein